MCRVCCSCIAILFLSVDSVLSVRRCQRSWKRRREVWRCFRTHARRARLLDRVWLENFKPVLWTFRTCQSLCDIAFASKHRTAQCLPNTLAETENRERKLRKLWFLCRMLWKWTRASCCSCGSSSCCCVEPRVLHVILLAVQCGNASNPKEGSDSQAVSARASGGSDSTCSSQMFSMSWLWWLRRMKLVWKLRSWFGLGGLPWKSTLSFPGMQLARPEIQVANDTCLLNLVELLRWSEPKDSRLQRFGRRAVRRWGLWMENGKNVCSCFKLLHLSSPVTWMVMASLISVILRSMWTSLPPAAACALLGLQPRQRDSVWKYFALATRSWNLLIIWSIERWKTTNKSVFMDPQCIKCYYWLKKAGYKERREFARVLPFQWRAVQCYSLLLLLLVFGCSLPLFVRQNRRRSCPKALPCAVHLLAARRRLWMWWTHRWCWEHCLSLDPMTRCCLLSWTEPHYTGACCWSPSSLCSSRATSLTEFNIMLTRILLVFLFQSSQSDPLADWDKRSAPKVWCWKQLLMKSALQVICIHLLWLGLAGWNGKSDDNSNYGAARRLSRCFLFSGRNIGIDIEFAPVCASLPCFVSGNGEYLEIPRSAVGRIIGAGGARIQAGCTRVGSKWIRWIYLTDSLLWSYDLHPGAPGTKWCQDWYRSSARSMFSALRSNLGTFGSSIFRFGLRLCAFEADARKECTVEE